MTDFAEKLLEEPFRLGSALCAGTGGSVLGDLDQVFCRPFPLLHDDIVMRRQRVARGRDRRAELLAARRGVGRVGRQMLSHQSADLGEIKKENAFRLAPSLSPVSWSDHHSESRSGPRNNRRSFTRENEEKTNKLNEFPNSLNSTRNGLESASGIHHVSLFTKHSSPLRNTEMLDEKHSENEDSLAHLSAQLKAHGYITRSLDLLSLFSLPPPPLLSSHEQTDKQLRTALKQAALARQAEDQAREQIVRCLWNMLGARVDATTAIERLSTELRVLLYDHERANGILAKEREKRLAAEKDAMAEKAKAKSVVAHPCSPFHS